MTKPKPSPPPQPSALPLPLPPPLINTKGFTEQVGQDHSFTKIHYYSSPGQVPFDWEAEPGRRKEEEKEKEKEKEWAVPLPLNLPPNMHSMSPAVSRTSSTLSDKRVITPNKKIMHIPSQQENYRGEADVNVFRSGCNPFSFFKLPHRSERKL